jgi:monovalent cation:H+ antiporter-2, CPA2 family
MRDLAEVWVPGQPVYLNEAYVERAKQLDRDLENALMDELHEVSAMAAEEDGEEEPLPTLPTAEATAVAEAILQSAPVEAEESAKV